VERSADIEWEDRALVRVSLQYRVHRDAAHELRQGAACQTASLENTVANTVTR
jgi:hypothetical protein